MNSSWHTFILACFVGILCYSTTKLGEVLAIGPQSDWPLWLGNVCLVSILLLVPREKWPALIAAAFSAYVINDIQAGLSLRTIGLLVLSDSVEVLFAAYSLSYVFKGAPRLDSLGALAKFSLFAVILTPCIPAVFAALTGNGNWASWRISYFSEAVVYLTLMPAILGWFGKRSTRQKSRGYYLEAAGLFTGLVFFGYLACAAPQGYSSEATLYSLVPFLVWSALRFGSTGVSTSAIAISFLAIWGATHGRGPFLQSGPLQSVPSVQLFLFFTAAPFMVLAAVVEENRQASEQLFRSIFENAQIGIGIFNVEKKQHFSNRALHEMLGYSEEELQQLERWDKEIVHPEESASGARRYAELVHGGKDADEYTQRFIRRDGQIVTASGRFTLIRDPGGKPRYVIALHEDISERKAAEDLLHKRDEELKRANFLAETALELAKAGYWHVPLDGSGWYNSSPRRVAAFGEIPRADYRYSLEELFEHARQGDEAAARKAQEAFNAAVEGKTATYDTLFAYKRPIDGRIAWLHALGYVQKDADGKPTDIYGVSQDITEFKQMEAELVTARDAAEAATRAKSIFLANMSHEIRTPMNAILGMMHLALKTELTPKQRDYLTKARVAAQTLLGIVSDILDFSKIEAGKLDMESVDFHLDHVLENLSSVVSQKAHDKNLEFLIAAPRDLPTNLVGDPLRLGQILINLVNNAVKFTDRGEVVVTVSLEERISDRVKLKFSVRDTGIGMTADQTARLFQAFGQADTSTTRKFGGTGLGLSISKRLVEMMRGEIRVDSHYRAGSTFLFTAWFGIGSAEPERKRFLPDLEGIRALVVDDNALACENLTDALKALALRVDSVSSGEAALRELAAADARDPHRLVLMDWHMPGMDGLEASRIILRGGRLKNVPKVVMVTAFGREDIRAQGEELGVDGYLLKPVTSSALFDTLVQLFGEVGDVAAGAAPISRNETIHDASGIRILLVEDNEVNQLVATELLESAGAIVRVANHGGEAVRILTEGEQPPPFDIVFMDLQMPEMDGFAATRLLRSRPHLKDLPIVAMTAHALVEERQRCLEAGMNDHVSKPIEPDVLFATLARWTNPRQGQAAGAEGRSGNLTDDMTLVEVDGMDVAGALKRVAGNKRLYRELLVQFASKQHEMTSQISAAIESGDNKLAERIVHTVKGVAGNIGLGVLFAAAEKLERAIRDRNPSVPALAEFIQAASRQVQLVQQAMGDARPDQLAGSERSEALDAQTAATAVAQLKALLEASDGDAVEGFLALERILAGTVDHSRLGALGAAIGEFDFDGARKRLNEITKEYGGNWEQPK